MSFIWIFCLYLLQLLLCILSDCFPSIFTFPPSIFSPLFPFLMGFPISHPFLPWTPQSSSSSHLSPSFLVPPVRLCMPCHSPCCPRLKHMALCSLLLSSINTVVSGNYRHIAQHARPCSGFWCWRLNKAAKDVRCLNRNLSHYMSNITPAKRCFAKKTKKVLFYCKLCETKLFV